ncbi:MAG: DUF4397 domain-containing protein [Armatimonadetes bacterium ATM1]|nr:MAG: DUF4397 domain-containing protein [Armatimonadota bacterium]MBC6969729.1 DUF4397 domain-containing protein [Armatimonadota bacterium]MCE7898997.1 DUF4397 domain-containing protein [Armatimonadetes bacterium ATM1]RIJ97980.1 MAG: hypothetical protein DCC45_02640 [Armatimonadota bacterium]
MRLTRRIFLLSSAFFLTWISGCGGSVQDVLKIFFRYTNAVPDLAGTDFFVDDSLNQANVAYQASMADFAELENREREVFFDAFEAGTSNLLDSILVEKRDEISFHVFAVGLGSPTGFQEPARLIAPEVTRTRPTGSNARIIWVHGYNRKPSAQTPSVDIFRSGALNEIVDGLEFAATRSINLAAGTYDFTVRIDGLEESELITKTGVSIVAGKIYVALLCGEEDTVGPTAPDILFFEESIKQN